jgi:hypothetical protein
MHPRFPPSKAYVSMLAYSPTGEHLSRGFVIGGLLAMLFFGAVCWSMRGRLRAAAALAMLAAGGLALVGLFPLPSIHPHNAAAAVAAAAAVSATVVLRQGVRRGSLRRGLDGALAVEAGCLGAAGVYVTARIASHSGSFDELLGDLPKLLYLSFDGVIVNPVAMLEWVLLLALVALLVAVSLIWLHGDVVLEAAHAPRGSAAADPGV